MSEKVNVQITATDGASRVFNQVASSADKMDSSLSKSETTMQRFSRTGAAIGAGLGALSGIMADAARASADAEVSQERLRTAIEASGDAYEIYAERLEAAGEAAVQMGFDDEDALDSISRLTTATGDAGEAIEQMGLIMDIARGRGISLAEATRIVEAVETGRMSTLRRLGIVIDETMSKEEALAELQRRYAGQAEAYSETTAGFYDRVRNQLENVQESLGEHAGALQTVLVLLPGLSAGWTLAAGALGGLFNAMGGTNGALGQLATLLTRIGGARAGLVIGLTAAVADGLIIAESAGEDTAKIWDEFAQKLPQIQTDINSMTAAGSEDMRTLGDEASAAFASISTAATSVEQAWEDGKRPFPDYMMLLGNAEVAAIGLNDALMDFNSIMIHTGPGAAAAQAQLSELFESFNKNEINAVELFDGINAINDSLDQLDTEAAAEMGESFRGAAGDILLADAALAAFNQQVIDAKYDQLAQQFNDVTAAYTATTDALSNGFRVIVGNTNAIGQQADAVFKWAEELIAAEGVYSKLDDLLAAGAISQRDYNAAQESYNTIAEDNLSIQEDIAAIQAQQVPIIADLMSEQAAYWDELNRAPEAQQRLALAYMDTATSAQALQLAQAAMAGTPGLEPLIEGALRANPLLEDILEDMGVISVGADGTVTILTEGEDELTNLVTAIESLVATEWIAMFSGDATAAEEAYEHATGLAVDWDGMESEATVAADTSPADTSFGYIQDKFDDYDGSTATAKANVDDNASGTLSNISALLNSMDGRSVTSYITVVQSKIGELGMGGVASYATGGVVANMGEYGTETLHFPTGGVAYTRGAGLYGVPQGTLVTPHTGLEASGGRTVNLYIENLYGDETLAEKVSREIVPAIQRAMVAHERGY